jgi:hypothetical protein
MAWPWGQDVALRFSPAALQLRAQQGAEKVCTGQPLTAGPSTTLRSGRDDNSVAQPELSREIIDFKTELSSRPERSVVEGPAVNAICQWVQNRDLI